MELYYVKILVCVWGWGVGSGVRQDSSLIMRPASVDIAVKYLAKPLKIYYLQIIACRWGGMRGVGGVETRLNRGWHKDRRSALFDGKNITTPSGVYFC